MMSGYVPVVPAAGIPAIVAVAAFHVRPFGNAPLSDHVTGAMAFVCEKVTEYGIRRSPFGIVVGKTVMVWQVINNEYGAEAEHPFASMIFTVIGKTPVCAGVPEIVAVAEFQSIPVGKDPMSDQV